VYRAVLMLQSMRWNSSVVILSALVCCAIAVAPAGQHGEAHNLAQQRVAVNQMTRANEVLAKADKKADAADHIKLMARHAKDRAHQKVRMAQSATRVANSAAKRLHAKQAVDEESSRESTSLANKALKSATAAHEEVGVAAMMAQQHQNAVKLSVFNRAEKLQQHLKKYDAVATDVAMQKIRRGKDMIKRGEQDGKRAKESMTKAKVHLERKREFSASATKAAQKLAEDGKTLTAAHRSELILRNQDKLMEEASEEHRASIDEDERAIETADHEVRRGKLLITTGKAMLKAPKEASQEATQKARSAAALRQQQAVESAKANLRQIEDAKQLHQEHALAKLSVKSKAARLDAQLNQATKALAKAKGKESVEEMKSHEIGYDIQRVSTDLKLASTSRQGPF